MTLYAGMTGAKLLGVSRLTPASLQASTRAFCSSKLSKSMGATTASAPRRTLTSSSRGPSMSTPNTLTPFSRSAAFCGLSTLALRLIVLMSW